MPGATCKFSQIDREKGLSPRKKKGKTQRIDLDPSRTFKKPSQQKSGKSERSRNYPKVEE